LEPAGELAYYDYEVDPVLPELPPPLVTQLPPVITSNSPLPVTPVFIPPVITSRSVFSAPTINSLESGKYYLQIAAYSNAEAVNPEISKIDNRLPVAVMTAGTSENPLYRLLIGPLTLGEAGALLQRFRSTHNDAFVRFGE
jgi:cell division septation protein DedD